MKYKNNKFANKIFIQLIIIIVSLIFSLVIINIFYNKFNKVILPLAIFEARGSVTEIINNATNNIEFDDKLFSLDKDENNEISTVTYNSNTATLLVNKITDNIQNEFNKVFDNDYIITKIPLGTIFGNGLLRNFGPMINVRLKIVGNVISELQTEVKPYGINNAIVEVRVKLNVSAKVILPLVSETIEVNNVIPIAINIVNGSVPEGYIASYK